MLLEEIIKIKDTLLENNYTEITSDNLELLDKFKPASEISRKLVVRFDNKDMSKVLTELSYKTYMDECGVPSSPDNSAFMMKSFTDEDTQVVDYYIQCLWNEDIVKEIDHILQTDQNFIENVLPRIREENEKEKNRKINEFKGIKDYVAFSVKKTGFNIKKDFTVYVSYTEIKDSDMVNNVFIPINDGIDEEKSEHYYKKDELTEMSPYDYIKINLPHVDPNQQFEDRKVALRKIYNDIKGKTVIFFNKEESRFLKKMFEDEGIPEQHSYENIILEDYGIKELVDWLNPDTDLKLKKVYEFYQIPYNKSENKYLQESKRLAQLIYRVLKVQKKEH